MDCILDSTIRISLCVLLSFVLLSCSSASDPKQLLIEAKELQKKVEQMNLNLKSKDKYVYLAINSYSEIINSNNFDSIERSNAFFSRGNLYLMVNDPINAINNFSSSIKFNQNNPETFYRRSIAYQIDGYIDKALFDLGNVIQLSPDHPFAYIDRALIYIDINELEKAKNDLSIGLKIDTQNYIAYTMRGTIYSTLRDYGHAINDYNKALKILEVRDRCPIDDNSCFSPDHVNIYQRLASAYEGKGDYVTARRIYGRGINNSPGSSVLLNSLAWLLATTDNSLIRNPREALKYALRANLIENSLNPDVLDTLAEAYYVNGKYREAVEYKRKAILLNPDDKSLRKSLVKFENKL